MGFSFGILIWFPIAFGGSKQRSHSLMGDNYLTFVSVYALLLLSDTLFWNVFGFDRSAAQVYFLVPLRNLHGSGGQEPGCRVLCAAGDRHSGAGLRVAAPARHRPADSGSVLGNVGGHHVSFGDRQPQLALQSARRESGKSFRTAAGARMQALLMLLFPVALAPVALAYLARYAFRIGMGVFWRCCCSARCLGGVVYWFSMESAVKAAERAARSRSSPRSARAKDWSRAEMARAIANSARSLPDDAVASSCSKTPISLAFLDHRPLFPGHTLLIPKVHYETLADLPANLVGPFFRECATACRARWSAACKRKGAFVAINNRVSQSVPHLHVHIVPRKKGTACADFSGRGRNIGMKNRCAGAGVNQVRAVAQRILLPCGRRFRTADREGALARHRRLRECVRYSAGPGNGPRASSIRTAISNSSSSS